jgi:hypothetical protein
MSLERAAMQGRLAEAKARKYELLCKADALCTSIRGLLNTALTDIEQIEIAQADQLMDDLMATMAELYGNNSILQRLERELK